MLQNLLTTFRPAVNPATVAPMGAVLCGILIAAVALPIALAIPIPVVQQDTFRAGAGIGFLLAALPVQPHRVGLPDPEPAPAPPAVPAPKPQVADVLHSGVPTACLPEQLRSALLKVQGSCAGFNIISANRPGAKVRGSGRTSLHASCKAADFTVNSWLCASRALKDFPGGVSTDPDRVGHIHASMARSSREYGARFAHWHPRHAVRHAKHHRRVVKVQAAALQQATGGIHP